MSIIKYIIEADTKKAKQAMENFNSWVQHNSTALQDAFEQATGKSAKDNIEEFYAFAKKAHKEYVREYKAEMQQIERADRQRVNSVKGFFSQISGKLSVFFSRSGAAWGALVALIIAGIVKVTNKLKEINPEFAQIFTTISNYADSTLTVIATKASTTFLAIGKTIKQAFQGNFEEAFNSLKDIGKQTQAAIKEIKTLTELKNSADKWGSEASAAKDLVEDLKSQLNSTTNQGDRLKLLRDLKYATQAYTTALARQRETMILADIRTQLGLGNAAWEKNSAIYSYVASKISDAAANGVGPAREAIQSVLSSLRARIHPELQKLVNLDPRKWGAITREVREANKALQEITESFNKAAEQAGTYVTVASEVTEPNYKTEVWYEKRMQAIRENMSGMRVGSPEYQSQQAAILQLQAELDLYKQFPPTLQALYERLDDVDEGFNSVWDNVFWANSNDLSSYLTGLREVEKIFDDLDIDSKPFKEYKQLLEDAENIYSHSKGPDYFHALEKAGEMKDDLWGDFLYQKVFKRMPILEQIDKLLGDNLTREDLDDFSQGDLQKRISLGQSALSGLTYGSERYVEVLRKIADIQGWLNRENIEDRATTVGIDFAHKLKGELEQGKVGIDEFFEYIKQHEDELGLDFINTPSAELSEQLQEIFDKKWILEIYPEIKAKQESLERFIEEMSGLGQAAGFANAAVSGLNQILQATDEDSKKHQATIAALTRAMVVLTIAEQTAAVAMAIRKAVESSKHWAEAIAAVTAATSTVLGAIAAAKSTIKSSQGYAEGGIVSGQFQSGDLQTIRVNAGEMVLTTQQQKNLFSMLNNGVVGGGGQVEFTIKGKDLVGVLNNTNKYNSLTK